MSAAKNGPTTAEVNRNITKAVGEREQASCVLSGTRGRAQGTATTYPAGKLPTWLPAGGYQLQVFDLESGEAVELYSVAFEIPEKPEPAAAPSVPDSADPMAARLLQEFAALRREHDALAQSQASERVTQYEAFYKAMNAQSQAAHTQQIEFMQAAVQSERDRTQQILKDQAALNKQSMALAVKAARGELEDEGDDSAPEGLAGLVAQVLGAMSQARPTEPLPEQPGGQGGEDE